MTLRLVVLISGKGSNLGAIAEAIDAGRCDAKIALVVSDRPDAAGLDIARSRGIETQTLPFEKGIDREAYSAALADLVAQGAPDLVVLAGFMRIVGKSFIHRFSGRMINIHPSLLPAFRGPDGVGDALEAGVKITGCTVHLVDEGVDTGRILAQAAVPVLPDDDRASLHARIQRAEHQLLPEVIHAIANARMRLDGGLLSRVTIDEDACIIVPRFES